MKADFLRWSKRHGITYKRRRDERAAYKVWNAMLVEHDSINAEITALRSECRTVVLIAQEMSEQLKITRTDNGTT